MTTKIEAVWPFNKPMATSCARNHKVLDLGAGVIHGGSCHSPIIKDADIYIAFDHKDPSSFAFPWTDRTEVLFPIANYKAPNNYVDFLALVEWTLDELEAGKKVHAGCFAGHGRTGMFFAALVAQLGFEADPISYVRENYCPKAVESREQVRFLVDVFHAKEAKPRAYPKAAKGVSNIFDLDDAGKGTTKGKGTDSYGDWYDEWKKEKGNG